MDTLLVTGMQRSGTTLLEKLLTNHPEISVLSQPFPFLFVEAKRRFLQDLGEDRAYPLGDLFLEAAYSPVDLLRFLEQETFDAGDVRVVFEQMASYSGQYTKVDPDVLDRALAAVTPSTLADLAGQLYAGLSGSSGAGARVHGGKETICEEFVPHFLAGGAHAAIIVRDPRDVLVSLNHGSGREHGGRLKPTLFNVRNWRKSVAFALHLESHPAFARVRYEDLTATPEPVLDELAALLGVARFPTEVLAGEIRDQSGRPWAGNSSHGALAGVSTGSVGTWADTLTHEVARLVEATCYPELVRLGYDVSLEWHELPEVITSFSDPYAVERPDLAALAAPEALRAEVTRLERLEDRAPADAAAWFLFDDVHTELRSAVHR